MNKWENKRQGNEWMDEWNNEKKSDYKIKQHFALTSLTSKNNLLQ